jgi:hypothetical protein
MTETPAPPATPTPTEPAAEPARNIPTGGVILIVLGGIFLYGLVTEGHAGRGMRELWPLILIAIGLTQIVNARFRDGGGLVLIVLGAGFLFFTLGALPWSSMEHWWPIGLIAVGLSIMLGRGQGRRRRERSG